MRTNLETKSFKFLVLVFRFLGSSDQNKLYHTPLLSKIAGLGNRIFCRTIPLIIDLDEGLTTHKLAQIMTFSSFAKCKKIGSKICESLSGAAPDSGMMRDSLVVGAGAWPWLARLAFATFVVHNHLHIVALRQGQTQLPHTCRQSASL